jgi:hypothetical protein
MRDEFKSFFILHPLKHYGFIEENEGNSGGFMVALDSKNT